MSNLQSFFFDWNPPDQPTPVPITAQCETIHINWSRQAATGPDPIAPYYLQIFTSHYIFPFQINAGSELFTNLTIPFAPGTQYQICMFDSVGNTGGCQDVYTVYPSSTPSAPSCSNFSMPATTLDVTSSFGQYSWIPSCSELTIQPNSGSPPYEVTVAPALHPPYNISNVGQNGVSWKLPLQWGIPFFVSVVDSTGLSWSYGPLHAGSGDQTCFAAPDIEVSLPITIASALAAMALGAILALVISLCLRYQRRKARPPILPQKGLLLGSDTGPYSGMVPFADVSDDSRRGLLTRRSDYSLNSASPDPDYPAFPPTHERPTSHVRPIPLSRGMNRSVASSLGSVYHVEAWQHPMEHGVMIPSDSRTETHVDPQPGDVQLSPPQPGSPSRAQSQHIYVVHHDRGPAPVSIYAEDGTELVELPPVYSRPPGPPPPGPSRQMSWAGDDAPIHQPGRRPTPTLNTHVPSSLRYAPSPIPEFHNPAADLCTTPTGLIPPRGIGWTNDTILLPEKSGYRQVDG